MQGVKKQITTKSNEPAKVNPEQKSTLQDLVLPKASDTRRLPPPPKAVRGVYLSSHVAASPDRMRSIHALLEQTDLNAVVVDINSGIRLTALPAPHTSAYGPVDSKSAEQLRTAIRNFKRRNVYTIARIVVFKDEALALARPDWAIRRKNGSLWRDRKGHAWVDPYKEEAWPYFQALVQEAAKTGFDEVQFDYVRFPENGAKVDREVIYANPGNVPKSRVISRFVRQATEHAHRLGIRASADVFGLVGSTHDDMGIGQRWTELSPATDVLSPMIYPSHYEKGIWGIRNPDLSPVAIITKALEDADKQNKALAETGVRSAEIRPWLQGFTASWIHPHQSYGAEQIREQIQAARKAGFSSYLIWNPACRYPVF